MPIAPHILVIDDDPAMREACLAVLEGEGYLVTSVHNGEAGLQTVHEQNVDLVLVDLKMPGMDGLEVLKRIREEDPELLVIMITAYGTVEAAVDAMKSGAFDFITKPFSPQELRLVVGRGLSLLKLSRQNRLLKE
jgi:DNA-binding NtrC family response regulator